MLGGDLDLVGHEEGRVEADTELADHRDVHAVLDRLHEGLGARLGDRAEVLDQLRLGHADTRVPDRERLVRPVGDDRDEHLGLRLEARRVGQRLVADLVERIRSVRDQLAEEDLLVRVERVDDQAKKLADVRREGEGLGLLLDRGHD